MFREQKLSLMGAARAATRRKAKLTSYLGFLVFWLFLFSFLFGGSLAPYNITDYSLVEIGGSSFSRIGCASHAPRDPRKTAICTIVKQEEPYLAEFVNYYFGIGVSTIYIYDNSDDFILKQWGREKQAQYQRHCGGGSNRLAGVQVIHWPGEQQQIPAYNDCARRAYSHPVPSRNVSALVLEETARHTWAAYFDCDEFLVMKKNNHISDFLATYLGDGQPKAGALAVTQLTIDSTTIATGTTSGGLVRSGKEYALQPRTFYSPMPLTKRFQFVLPAPAANQGKYYVKLIIRLDRVDAERIQDSPFKKSMHEVGKLAEGSESIRTNGHRAGSRGTLVDVAALYHYHAKSSQEYVQKRQRGSAIQGRTEVDKRLRVATRLHREALASLDSDGSNEGHHIFRKGIFDDSAWKAMKKHVPVYAVYDDLAEAIPM